MTTCRSNFYLLFIFIILCTPTFGTAIDSNSDDDNISRYEYNPGRSRREWRKRQKQNYNVYSPDTDMQLCIRVIKRYCNIDESDLIVPNALECILEAIDNWTENNFPEGVLKKYYLGLIAEEGSLASLSRYVLKREDYCNQPEIPNSQLCKETLADFKDTAEDAVKYALYSKRSADFLTVVTRFGHDRTAIVPTDNYSLGYIHHIKKFIYVNEEIIQKPINFCTDVCYDYKNVEFPLDWSPYLAENMYV